MTLRESLIEKFFDMADKFVRKVEEISPPGIIGPFGLQCVIEDDMKPTCYDVAFRIPGGDDITGYWGHVYLNTLWHQRMSTGRRLSLEIKRAIDCDLLEMIVT
jgi:5-formaminoimidazole-4-carboxamide-1-(beta)-D-ribofuranosyl 5'-monophosphate synthetase